MHTQSTIGSYQPSNRSLARLAQFPTHDLQYGIVTLYVVFIKSPAAHRAVLPALLPAQQIETPVFALVAHTNKRHVIVDDYALDAQTSQAIVTQNAYMHAAHLLHTARHNGVASECVFDFNKQLLERKFLRNTHYQALLLMRLGSKTPTNNKEDNAPTHGDGFVIV